MSQTDPDARFRLDPHEYRKIAAPLRRKKADVEVIVLRLLIFWLVATLVIWPAGLVVAGSLREQFAQYSISSGTFSRLFP